MNKVNQRVEQEKELLKNTVGYDDLNDVIEEVFGNEIQLKDDSQNFSISKELASTIANSGNLD